MAFQPQSTVSALWARAVAHSRAGRLAEAASAFDQFLALVPEHAGAHYNLAVSLKALNRLDEAAQHYQRTILLDPSNAKAHNNLGVILSAQKRTDEALDRYKRALALQPDYANANYNYANALSGQGDTARAIEHYRRALAGKPDDAETHNNLGVALAAEDRFNEALTHYQRALTLRPSYIEAYGNLGSALEAGGRSAEAIAIYRTVLKRDPAHANAHYNLGRALDSRDSWNEAEACYERALALDPGHAEAHNNFGLLSQRLGRWAEALARFERAQTLNPDYADAHWNEALTRLRLGDFAVGWRKYEWRWRRRETPPRTFAAPPWDGSPLIGKTILLHAEQGHGDAIQFIRYAPLVRALGAKVIVECPSALHVLFSNAAGINDLVNAGDVLPPFDLHAPLLSLPLRLGATAEIAGAGGPYLSADLETAEKWRVRTSGLASRKIGLVWRGNAAHSEDRLRSVDAVTLTPLLEAANTAWVSLQVGSSREDLAAFAPTPIFDAGAMLDDWADTAALISTLDLVITVDTAVAHLAGALGKPVWVLLPFMADWRWLLDRTDSPWYATMRLFRQPSPGDWTSVVADVHAALQRQNQNGDLPMREDRPPAPRLSPPRLPPLLVVSHERSGTHFLMNALSYAYGYTAQPWIDLDIHNPAIDLSRPSSIASSLESLTPDPLLRIVKSHHAADIFADALARITATYTILYVYRNPSCVMTSLWRHLNDIAWDEGPKLADPMALARAAPAGGMIRYDARSSPTMLLRWASHVEGWLSRTSENLRIIPLRYEDLDGDYETTVASLGSVIGRDPIRPLLRPSRNANVIAMGRDRPSWPTTPAMSAALVAFCEAEVGPLLHRLGYVSSTRPPSR
jgi:tetratricopeptide (TPR) repeat protein